MIQINKAGYTYILVTIAIGFSAVNTGNNLVFLITSALLSYMIVSGVFGSLNLRNARVSLKLPEDIFAGIECPATLTVRTAGSRRACFLLRASVMGCDAWFPYVTGGTQEERIVPLHFNRRGRHSIPSVHLSSPFPFNLFTRHRDLPLELDVIVYPKPLPDPSSICRTLSSPQPGDPSSTFPGHDGDILSIRNYVPGDPIKTINWKATAKTDTLKTKELSVLHYQNQVIDLDHLDEEDLENELSRLTHTLLTIVRLKIPVVMIVDGVRLQPGLFMSHKNQVLRKLALYDED